MKIGDFGLEICGKHGAIKGERDGYVAMEHGEQYSLRLTNDSPGRVNLYIKIDGVSVGDFQMDRGDKCLLERHVRDRGKFTFFASNTSESASAGEATVSSNDKGLVEVAFVPEVPRPPMSQRLHAKSIHDELELTRGGPCGQSLGYCSDDSSVKTMSFTSGITGQTGYSSQEFGRASHIVEDPSRKVVITLRLVAEKGLASSGVRPLPGRMANPVPAPVG